MLFGILEFEVRTSAWAYSSALASNAVMIVHPILTKESFPSDPRATKSSRKENWFTGRWPWKGKLQQSCKERNEKRGQMAFVYFGTRVVM